MKRTTLVLFVAAMALAPISQAAGTAEGPGEITHGMFAAMLLDVIATREPPHLEPAAALEKAQALELLPAGWKADGTLTQSELANALQGLCPSFTYQPGNPTGGVSKVFATVLVRRTLPCIQRSLAGTLGEGTTDIQLGGNIGSEPVPISPSGF